MNNHTIGKATLIVSVLSALLMLNACGGIVNNNASGVGGARSQNSSPRETVDFAHIEKEYQDLWQSLVGLKNIKLLQTWLEKKKTASSRVDMVIRKHLIIISVLGSGNG